MYNYINNSNVLFVLKQCLGAPIIHQGNFCYKHNKKMIPAVHMYKSSAADASGGYCDLALIQIQLKKQQS